MRTTSPHTTIRKTLHCDGWEIWFPTCAPLLTRTLLALCFCFALTAMSAHAATRTVTKTEDTNDNVCNADCSLREAIAVAAPSDTIIFASPLFDSPQIIELTDYNDFSDFVINKNLEINGKGAHLLTIRGTFLIPVFGFRIFNVNGAGVTVILRGMTISGGGGGYDTNGGGINNNGGSNLTVSACHITGNIAANGGGIYNAEGSTLTLIDSTVSNNVANYADVGGGGIDNRGTLSVTNSTISGNTKSTSNSGGGIYSSGTATITNSTITDNDANRAGSASGIYNASGTITIRNTIIAANRNNTSRPDTAGAFTSSGYNLIGNVGSATGFTQTVDQKGTATAPLDPQLTPLALNGGTTPTHALAFTSPALDRGKASGTTDQRGFARVVDNSGAANAPGGDGSDIGALEARVLIVTKAEDTSDNVCGADCSLREAIATAKLGDTIGFASPLFDTPQTITLSNDLRDLVINKNMTITGTGAHRLTIRRTPSQFYFFRIFNVNGSGVVVTIRGITITGGDGGLDVANGGGINNNGGSNLTLTECHVTGNRVQGTGGGIQNAENSTMRIERSAISNNTATGSTSGGGGVDNRGTLVITDSTISGNTKNNASDNGGGFWTNTDAAITNSTITDNVTVGAGSASGSYRASGTVTIGNTIIAANRNNMNVPDTAGAFGSSGYNLIGNPGVATGFTQSSDQTGSTGTPLNPRLAALMLNGGTTPTHALEANSPAIDRGNRFGATRDQRGVPRPFDFSTIQNAADGTDIGAFELLGALAPAADTWVQGADAFRNTNYGASPEMQVKRTLNPGAGRGRRGFIKFDTSSITGTISSAKLRIFARLTDASLPPTGMIVQKVTDTLWDELTMTWNNQPLVESPNALSQITVTNATGQYYEFDLTAFIQQERAAGRSVISLRLINQQSTGNSGAFYTVVNSREATSNQPQLVIEQ